MIRRFFIDTCVWRDFYESRKSYLSRDLSQEASGLFEKIIKNKWKIYFTDLVYRELMLDYDKNEIVEMFSLLFNLDLLIRIDVSHEECIKAESLSLGRNLPFADCLFAILSKNNKLELISQDRHILENLKDIAKVKRPDQI